MSDREKLAAGPGPQRPDLGQVRHAEPDPDLFLATAGLIEVGIRLPRGALPAVARPRALFRWAQTSTSGCARRLDAPGQAPDERCVRPQSRTGVIEGVDVLSEREVRVLSEIEEGLILYDPDFADLMTTSPEEGPGRRGGRPTELLIIIGTSLLPATCMVLADVGAGLVLAVFAASTFALRRAWLWRPGQRP